jgi:thiosulfate/3-mercaptopyruvate sulfurtransferase
VSAIIETDALAARLGTPHLRIVDASWYMPADKRDTKSEFKAAHIPGSIFFDIDEISDRGSPYPHMLPSTEQFVEAVSALGIGNDDQVVVYDSNGIFSAARVWWMFRVFGHDNVKVLNGGLPKWKAENKPLESGDSKIKPALFTTHFRPTLLRSLTQMQKNVATKHEQVVDARSAGRFKGTEPEPRPGLGSGHIPGSSNVFFKECLSAPYNTLKPVNELRAIYENKKIDYLKPMIASCGSGVTACILALALYELGNKEVAIYDGAWAQWGSQENA